MDLIVELLAKGRVSGKFKASHIPKNLSTEVEKKAKKRAGSVTITKV